MEKPLLQAHKEEHLLFNQIQPSFSKSKEDIWASLSSKIDDVKTIPTSAKVRSFPTVKFAIAASVLLLLGAGLFSRFYTTTIQTQGEIVAYLLPDGSEVTLNKASNISYQPYWWKFNREISFEGEAFFQVKKGKTFAVKSNKGTTEVLGTSFNISTKNNSYQVFCKTGKVKVADNKSNKAVILTPNMSAEIKNQIFVNSSASEMEALAWKIERFSFKSTPLTEVMQTIEKEYDIQVHNEIENWEKLKYSGSFKKGLDAESTLRLVLKSYSFKLAKIDDKNYRIFSE